MPEIGDIVRASDLEANKPQLHIGTVTTGEAGTNASASITGTSPNFILDMTIPRGNNGEKGEQGEQGASGVFTGPLMPTSAYWRYPDQIYVSYQNYSIRVPSGGTWAILTTRDGLGGYIYAGGTQITTWNGYDSSPQKRYWCWRIQ